MATALLLAASDPSAGSDEHRAVIALTAGLVLVLLLLLIALVMFTLLWPRTRKRSNVMERDLAGLRAKVDELEDLWSEAGARYGTAASTRTRPRGSNAPRPGGRSLDAGGDDGDDPPPPGFS